MFDGNFRDYLRLDAIGPGALPGLSPTAATFSSTAENGKNSVLIVLIRRSFVSSGVGSIVSIILLITARP